MNSAHLCLESFRTVLGLHRWHFWQLADGRGGQTTTALIPVGSCDDVVREYAALGSSGNFANGRAEVRDAISEAEELLRVRLGFPVVRTWNTERIALRGGDGNCKIGKACMGSINKIGAERCTVLGDFAVAYSDADGDGLLDTFNVLVPASALPVGMTESELVVTFADADMLPCSDADSERGRICPIVTQVLNNGDWLLCGKAWTAVRPILYEGVYAIPTAGGSMTNASLDVYNLTNYAATMSVKRHWTDGSVLPAFGRNECNSCGKCGGCRCVQSCCGDARVLISNCETGTISVQCTDADYVDIAYEAGYQCDGCGIDWDRVITRLAATLLNAPCCACESANKEFARWVSDRAYSDGGGNGFRGQIIESPLGSREGALWAWQAIKNLRLGSGILK